MEKIRIDINFIKSLNESIEQINKLDLSEIEFYDSDNDNVIDDAINIPPEIIDEYKFTGLNNMDFILSGFYKDGWDVDDNQE